MAAGVHDGDGTAVGRLDDAAAQGLNQDGVTQVRILCIAKPNRGCGHRALSPRAPLGNAPA